LNPKGNVVQTVLSRMALCGLVVAIGWPAAAGEPLTVRVLTTSRFAPSDVVVQAFIESDSRNREVSFEVDSAAYYTRSEAELEGDEAPRSKEVTFRMLPAGSYKVCVTLLGTDGRLVRVVQSVDLR
jgi:hypothetical protein